MEHFDLVLWLLLFPLFEEIGMYLRFKRAAKIKFSDFAELTGSVIYFAFYLSVAVLLYY